jgi:hypothetical protein
MTNEQQIIKIEDELRELRNNYRNYLKKCVLSKKLDIQDVLTIQELGNKYFNYSEQFVGNSGLLGAHVNGKWVTGFAESCHSILEEYVEHFNLLRSETKDLLIFEDLKPNVNAFANMQRMVVEYLPNKQVKELKNKFIKNQLPISGFLYRGAENLNKGGQWKDIVGAIIGILGMLLIVWAVIQIPEPSTKQFFIFRGLFALCAAMLVILIPGALNVRASWNKTSVKATGAIAVFVIIWMVNPPALV